MTNYTFKHKRKGYLMKKQVSLYFTSEERIHWGTHVQSCLTTLPQPPPDASCGECCHTPGALEPPASTVNVPFSNPTALVAVPLTSAGEGDVLWCLVSSHYRKCQVMRPPPLSLTLSTDTPMYTQYEYKKYIRITWDKVQIIIILVRKIHLGLHDQGGRHLWVWVHLVSGASAGNPQPKFPPGEESPSCTTSHEKQR